MLQALRHSVARSSRCVSSFSTLAVTQTMHGSPADAYKLGNIESNNSPLGATEVALKFLAAPISKADIDVATGSLAGKKLPAIGGSEGVAVVQKVGSSVGSLKEGDLVIPHGSSVGTWTQSAKADQSALMKVSQELSLPYAATIGSQPSVAYRLLRDFVDLKPGDVVLQNGANSMVGLAVTQMCREMGVKTINVIREDRHDILVEQQLLSNLGGDVNITDEYLASNECNEVLADLPEIKLALDCIGGESATKMSRCLAKGGTLVSYGAMSGSPITIPFDIISRKSINLRGFQLSKWIEKHSVEERQSMLDDITSMILKNQLAFFYVMHDFDDFPYALIKAQEEHYFRKVVLNLDFPDRMKEHDELTDKDYEMFEADVN